MGSRTSGQFVRLMGGEANGQFPIKWGQEVSDGAFLHFAHFVDQRENDKKVLSFA